MEPQSPKNYTAADIERYHTGGMSHAEMHALEKAALDDPFLSDALDGYVHTQTPAADISFLKDQLHRHSGKVIPMQRFNRRLFLGIAAMVILLAGFGWVVYQLSSNKDQNIAVQQEATPQQIQPLKPEVADSISTAPKEPVEPKIATTKKHGPAKALAKKAHATNHETAGTKVETSPDEIAAGKETFSNAHAAAPASQAENNAAIRLVPENNFKAQVVDAHNNPVPYAVVTDTQKKIITNTDAAGNFTVASLDSNVTVAINSAGYQQQQQTLTPADSATRIMLQPTTNTLNEVVVAAKKMPAANNSRVQLEAAKPVGGLNRFNAYVDKNIKAEDSASLIKENEVILSFDVDQSGNAFDITVEKSLCPSCDTTAVKLIQQGAKWEKTKHAGKARARIRF